MKRYSLITLFFLTLTLSAFAFQDPEYPNLEFTVLNAEAKTVSVKGINNASTDPIIIPATVNDGVNDYTVTTIADQGFYNYSKITKIVFPEGLKTIGDRAFAHCTAISDTIILPSTLKSIYSFAAFYNVPTPAFIIKSPTPPTIAFSETYGLLPNIPICIPSGTRNAYNDSVEWSKYKQLFCDEEIFTDGKYIYNVLSSTTASASGYVGNLYSIADTVSIKAEVTNPFNNQTYQITEIGSNAFYSCTKITSVQLSENIERIGDKAFAHDSLIVGELVLPASLRYIGEKVFYNLLHLDTLTILSPTPPTLLDNASQRYNTVLDVFFNLPESTRIQVPCNTLRTYKKDARWKPFADRYVDACITLIDNIYYLATDTGAVVIGYESAPSEDLSFQTDVTFGNETLPVVAIADSCFIQTKITSVSFPQNVASIGKCAFFGCSLLTSLTLPENIAIIAGKAFAHDSLIDGKLSLPNSLSYIGEKAFYNLLSLDTLDIQTTNPPALFQTGSEEFCNLPQTTVINIPCNTLRTYNTNAQWRLFTNQFVDPCMVLVNNFYYQATNKGAEVIGFETTPHGEVRFENTVTINGTNLNVVTITDRFLANNTFITTLTLPTYCTTLGRNSFLNCTNLTKIYLNDSLQTIGDSCFMGGRFDTIVMPSTLRTIGNCSFRDNPNLRGLFLNEGLQSIGERAFTYDSALIDTIIIPSSIIHIGAAVFTGCNKLTHVILRGSNPPQVTSDQYQVFGSASEFIVPCGSTEAYKTEENYWKDLSSKIKNDCKPLILSQGDILERDTAVSSITFRRTFDLDVWQTLYLPFDVASVLVEEIYEGESYYYNINKPYDPSTGGYFYLNEIDTIDENAATITFSTATTLKGKTPYLIQFPKISSNGYFEEKNILFKSEEGEFSLKKLDYIQPTASSQFQVSGNSSVYNQSVSDMYIFRATKVPASNGSDSVKYEFNQQSSSTLHPFDFGLLPYVEKPNSVSAPKRISLRIGRSSGNTGGGGITTSVSETHASNAITYRTGAGELALSLNGLPCQLYSVSGTLLYSSAGGTEEITIPLEKGIYILYSEGQSQKIVL